MATITWANPVSGYFQTGSNWVGGVAPSYKDIAVLSDSSATDYVVYGNGIDVAGVQIAQHATLRADSYAKIYGDSTIAGVLEIRHQRATLKGTMTDTATGILEAYAGTFLMNGATISGGILETPQGGTFATQGYCALDGFAVAVHNQGYFQVANSTLLVEGAIANSGQFAVSYGTLEVGVATKLTGGGTIRLANNIHGQIVEGPPGLKGTPASLTNVDNTIMGAGTITANVTNGVSGLIEANQSNPLTLSGATAPFENDGVLEVNGTGGMTLAGSVVGTGSVDIVTGTLTAAAGFSQNVNFQGSTGELILAQSQGFGGAISGMASGTLVDLRDIAFTGFNEGVFSGTTAGGVLTVSDGTHTAHITLTGDYLNSEFYAHADNHGGVSLYAAAPLQNIYWASAASYGYFHTGTNWTGGARPQQRDVAVLGTLSGAPFTVSTGGFTEYVNSVEIAANAVLRVAGYMTLAAGTGAGVNAGQIVIIPSARLDASGTIDGAGVIDINDGGLGVGVPGLTLEGGGKVVFGYDQGGRIFDATYGYGITRLATTLTNVNDTIFGTGTIGGVNYLLSLNNEASGVIQARGGPHSPGEPNAFHFDLNSLTNAGLISSVDKSGVYMNVAGVINNSGTIDNLAFYMTIAGRSGGSFSIVNTGVIETTSTNTTLTFNKGVIDDTAGGVLLAATGDNLVLQNATVEGGALKAQGSGKISAAANNTLDGTVSKVSVQGYLSTDETLAVAGVIANAGTLRMLNEYTALSVVAGGATLTGAGQVILSVKSSIEGAVPGVVLTSSNTISGAGTIGPELTLINTAGGVINANSAYAMVLASGATLVNDGLVEVTAAGGLLIDGGLIDGSGGGVLQVAAGDQVQLEGAILRGGTLRTSGTGQIVTLDSVSLIDGSASTVTDAAHVVVSAGESLTVAGAIANSGTLSLNSFSDLVAAAGGATLTGGGRISLAADGSSLIKGAAPGTSLATANAISGGGTIGANLMLTNLAGGVIDANSTYALLLEGGVVNAGLIEATGSSTLDLRGVSIANAAGTVSGVGGSVFLQGATIAGGALGASGLGLVHAQSGVNLLDGTAGSVTTTGTIIVNSGASLTAAGVIANAGQIDLNSGGAAASLVVGAAGLTLAGKGHVLLDNSAKNLISGGVLTNAGNWIFGGGDIGGGAMSLINQGIIDATDATPLILDTGAATIVNSGTIEAVTGGVGQVMSAVENDGLLLVNGGSLTVNGAVTGTGRVNIKAGTLTLASGFNQIISFVGTKGAVALADSQAFTNLVYGFSTTGATSLDLEDIAFGGSTTASFSGTTKGGVLTVSDGTHTAHIHLQGNYTASTFAVSSDGHGGTSVVDPPAASGSSAASLTQALASFQVGPAPHLAGTPAYKLPHLPLLATRG